MRRRLVYAAVALAPAVPAARISAQSGPSGADSALATLVTPNGEMRLTLTGRALRVGFTGLGQRRIRRAADSAFAAKDAAKGAQLGRTRSGRADDAPPPPDQAKRDAQDEQDEEKPDKPIPLRDVESVRLALEMAVTEEVEAAALRARAATAEPAWRAEETVAAIADDLLVPAPVRERWEALRALRGAARSRRPTPPRAAGHARNADDGDCRDVENC